MRWRFRMSDINRGSEWRKWDLHLHSPYNLIQGKGSYPAVQTNEDIKNVNTQFIQAIKAAGLSAIGLTNYIKFDDRDFILKEELEKEGIAVFMNLELRLTVANKEDQLLDYHIVFSDEVSKDEIDIFLARLNVQTGDKTISAKMIDLANINKATLDFGDIHNTLKDMSSMLNGKYLTAFLSRGHGHAIGEGKYQTVYERVARESDIVLHSSSLIENLKQDRNYWLHYSSYKKPVLQSSDAHCFEAIGVEKRVVESKHNDKEGVYPEGEQYFVYTANFSWIKADLSFDGLRQIIFEPEGRVAYGIESPDKKSDYLVIDHVDYKNKTLLFNGGLNAIIGGRSTGKSTLLKSIAKKQGEIDDVDHTLMNEGYDFSVIWRDGNEDPSREVEYISQNYMQEVAENPSLLNEIIKKILRNKDLLNKEDQYSRDVSELKSVLSQSVQKYFDTVSKYQNLQKPEGDLTGVDKQINNLESQIQGILINNHFTESEKVAFEKIEKEIVEIAESLKGVDEEIHKLETLKHHPTLELNSQFQYYMDRLSDVNKDLIDSEISALLSEVNSRISQTIETRIIAIRQDKVTLQRKQQSYTSQKIYKKGLAIRGSSNILSQLYESRQIEINKRNQIESYDQERIQLWEEINQEMRNLATGFVKYKSLVDKLAADYELSAGDLTIKLNVRRLTFEDRIDFLNSRDRANREFISMFDEMEFDDDQMYAYLINMFPLHTESIEFKFNRNQNIGDLIKAIFVNDWFDYDYEIIYQGDSFKQMSQGKKAFVVLQLLLDYSDNRKPILIDQPEDSLDNRAIYNELRKYIVNKKNERQIIVVTHNPNIVVGADAENVIVANQHSAQTPNENSIKFDYVNGALENSKTKDSAITEILNQQGIREHVFEILEGGKEAFEKREQKYNVK